MKRLLSRPVTALALCSALAAAPAQAGTEAFIGEVMITPYNFCPLYTMPADGRLLSIAEYSALFSLVGTYFGGDGITTFALPDLRGRAPVGIGTGPGLSPVDLGEMAGAETVTLTSGNLPAHAHSLGSASGTVVASTEAGTSAAPGGKMPADSQRAAVYADVPADAGKKTDMAAGTVKLSGSTSATGSSTPVSIRNPYVGLNFCIVVEGIYPSRP